MMLTVSCLNWCAVNLPQCWSQLGSLLWLKNVLKCSVFCSAICPVATSGQQCSSSAFLSSTQATLVTIFLY